MLRENVAYDKMQRDSLTTGGWFRRLRDRRTSRHCFIFYSVRAGGGCGNSLPNVHPKKKKKIMHEIKPDKRNNMEKVKNGNVDTDDVAVTQSF